MWWRSWRGSWRRGDRGTSLFLSHGGNAQKIFCALVVADELDVPIVLPDGVTIVLRDITSAPY